ncbi:MAG: amino acid ABC transporter substrate-binding protein [bacterium]|nr:amino acid ABC transporter substrate-binding protein [bacterium]
MPPWKICSNSKVSGAEKDVMDAIAKKLDLEPRYFAFSFNRCMRHMKNGSLDITTGLFKTTERMEFIDYIEPPYKKKSNKVFYVLKGRKNIIKSYSDLYSYSIGTVVGRKLFPQFDNDNKLKKRPNQHVENLFKQLLDGSIDSVILTDSEGDYLINKLQITKKVEKAKYGYYEINPVFIGLSKKSSFAGRKKEIITTIENMIKSGEIDSIIQNFFKKSGLPAPDYK